MKTNLPTAINTVQEAQIFLTELYTNGESYHPEDSAHGIEWSLPQDQQPTPAECDTLDRLFEEIYNLDGNNGNHANPKFDPCEWLLDIDCKRALSELYNPALCTEINNGLFDNVGDTVKYAIEPTNTGVHSHYTLTLSANGDVLGYYVYPSAEIAETDINLLNLYMDIEFID